LQEEETTSHILLGYVYVREVWFGVMSELGITIDIPVLDDSLVSWWFPARARFRRKDRIRFNSLVILVIWCAGDFGNKEMLVCLTTSANNTLLLAW
jgi:hypothetical protein